MIVWATGQPQIASRLCHEQSLCGTAKRKKKKKGQKRSGKNRVNTKKSVVKDGQRQPSRAPLDTFQRKIKKAMESRAEQCVTCQFSRSVARVLEFIPLLCLCNVQKATVDCPTPNVERRIQ